MSRVCTVVCFFEDIAHEAFITELVRRAAKEQGKVVEIDTRNATGGAKVWGELKAFLRDLVNATGKPDILVVVVDGNCKPKQKQQQVMKLLQSQTLRIPHYVIGVPDPHIERWYLEDPNALPQVVSNATPQLPHHKCQKSLYKNALRDALRAAGLEPVLGGAEYGAEIAAVLDPYIVSKGDSYFDRFWKDLNNALKLCQMDL
jgi:hypothetical protein